ncbi:MAG: ribosome biogenesis GTPase YlqF [Tissierellales bacterium]|nr:ribosome biogenesis GTPase YlqF [Tissierellales bacterium]
MDININWYPGHMKKTTEAIRTNLKLVDIVYELLDSRIPYSSQNPSINSILENKQRIIILNKSDLANPNANNLWKKHFNNLDTECVFLNSLNGEGIIDLISLTKKIVNKRSIKVMIVGIPNVGKSTLINRLSNRKSTKTGNKPGITKSVQWINAGNGIYLLDTPGVLWPKFEEVNVGLNLAFVGSIKDEVIDTTMLSLKLVEKLNDIDKNILIKRYNIDKNLENSYNILENIAKRRGCISKGSNLDIEKASNIIIDDFRKGLLGKITLEFPNEVNHE